MSPKTLFTLLLIVFLSNCKKENDRPQWDVQVLGPLLHAQLGIGQLIGDTSITTTSDGAQILDIDTTFSDFNLDSIYQVNDTTIPTYVRWLAFPSNINPNTPFYSNNNQIALALGPVKLKMATIGSGKIRLEIKNTLHSKVKFVYTIPGALKNGIPFSVTATVDSGSIADPKYFTNEYDFSGYDVNLTGPTGVYYNTVTYNVEARSDSAGYPFSVGGLDTLVNLKTTLISIKPYFVLGYLGQAETNTNGERNTKLGTLIKSGTIKLDSVEMKFDFINYIGADEQAFITSIQSTNNRTGNTVGLLAPTVLQHYLNINRATRNALLTDPVSPSFYSLILNKNNSNIKDLLENIPDNIRYDLKLNLNPLGNISGNNDFVYSDRTIDFRLQIKMPLRFALNQLVLVDTLDFSISNATDFDPIGKSTMTLVAENGFPFDLNAQLFLLDSTLSIIDSLFLPDYIQSAPYDINYRSTGVTRTQILIPIDADRKKRLLSVKRVGIRIKFNTPDFPQLIQMYSDYKLDLKLIADGLYSIR